MMASIEANTRGNKLTAISRHKHNMHVDLTPMVDLGFLLITFFILTTRLIAGDHHILVQTPNPADSVMAKALSESDALTFLLAKENKVFYYTGNTPAKSEFNTMQILDATNKKELLKTTKKFAELHNKKFGKANVDSAMVGHVFVKPDTASTYENLITVLDAILINKINSYSIDEITKSDAALLD
jgi:biopolymer transport protein ExbD